GFIGDDQSLGAQFLHAPLDDRDTEFIAHRAARGFDCARIASDAALAVRVRNHAHEQKVGFERDSAELAAHADRATEHSSIRHGAPPATRAAGISWRPSWSVPASMAKASPAS